MLGADAFFSSFFTRGSRAKKSVFSQQASNCRATHDTSVTRVMSLADGLSNHNYYLKYKTMRPNFPQKLLTTVQHSIN